MCRSSIITMRSGIAVKRALRRAAATAAGVSLVLTSIMCLWEWAENPGGIFRGPDGTNWAFVYDTAISWLVPTFLLTGVVVGLASLVHSVVTDSGASASRD